MSTAGDGYITKEDIKHYLEEENPAEFEDQEQQHMYDMLEYHWSEALCSPQESAESHLTMAKYYLQHAWIVEDEREK